MARGTATYVQQQGSLAAYKAWAQTMSTMLNQALVRTADTGQVNWAAIATEPVGTRDYEVFALGGTLQATAPIFIRFDYIGGASAGPFVTVGTTTDGAGNIGGLTVPYFDFLPFTSTYWSTTYSMWAASDRESYFTFLFCLDVAAAGADGVGMIVVERIRDVSGAPTATGFHAWRWQANTGALTAFQGGWQKLYGVSPQPVSADFNMGVFVPDIFNTNTALVDTTAYAYPAYTNTPLSPGGASKALMFAYPGEFPRGQAVTVTHYGEPQTFVSLGDSVTNAIPLLNQSNAAATRNLAPLIRWD